MRNEDEFVCWAGIVIILVLSAAVVGWAEFVYGDWRCAFAECRIVVEE